MLFRQSILSQFSHKTKVAKDTTEEAENDVAFDELDDSEQEMEDEVDGIDEEDPFGWYNLSAAHSYC